MELRCIHCDKKLDTVESWVVIDVEFEGKRTTLKPRLPLCNYCAKEAVRCVKNDEEVNGEKE